MFKLILIVILAYLVGLIVLATRLELGLAIPVVVIGLLLPVLIVKRIFKRFVGRLGAQMAEAAGSIWQGTQARVVTIGICERPAQLDPEQISLPDQLAYDGDDAEDTPGEDEESTAELQPLGFVAVVLDLTPDLDVGRAALDDPDQDDDAAEPRWDPAALSLGLASEADSGTGLFDMFTKRTSCAYYELLDADGTVVYDNGEYADQDDETEPDPATPPRYDLATRERYREGLAGPGRVRLVFPIGPRFNGQAAILYAFQHPLVPIQLPLVEIAV